MDDIGNFNGSINLNIKKDDLDKNYFNDLLIKDNEDNQLNNKDEFKINKDEIEANSPELFQDLLCPKEPNSHKEEEKNENNMQVLNNKDNNKKLNIINFEDLIKRKRDKSKKKSESKKKKDKIKIDFNGRLYQPKKKYYEENINNKNKEKNVMKRNKSAQPYKYNEFLNKKKESSSVRKDESKNKTKKDNKKIIDEFIKRNYPKKKENTRNEVKEHKSFNNIIKKKNNIKSTKSRINKIPIDLNKIKNRKIIRSYENKRNIRNNSSSKIRADSSKKSLKKIRIEKIPDNIIETEIDDALKNKVNKKSFIRDISPFKDKYERYNTEQMRYNLMKEYSNIKPKKENGFLKRMKFYSLKRKKNQEKINKLIEENKVKINKIEIDKTFNRLINDANRRIIQKKEEIKNKELEEEINKENNYIKYNDEEWNKIYEERFKEYEEYKKKKLEIEIEKEKIDKLIQKLESNMKNKNLQNIILYEKEKDNLNKLNENKLNSSNGILNNNDDLNEFQSYESFKNKKNL